MHDQIQERDTYDCSFLNSSKLKGTSLGSTPLVLSKLNFNRNQFELSQIELTSYMFEVIQHVSLVSHTPSSKKKRKKKGQIVTKPKPKSQGPDTSGVLPKETKVSTDHVPDPHDSESHKQLFDIGLLVLHPDDGTRKSSLLHEGKKLVLPDSDRITQLNDEGTNQLITDQLGIGSKDQADKTQSTRFKELVPDQNHGKTSLEVEPAINPPHIFHLVKFMIFWLIQTKSYQTSLMKKSLLLDKHIEFVASYVDLRANVENFNNESFTVRAQIDQAITKTLEFVETQQHNQENIRTSILESIWGALGRKARDLGSIRDETGKNASFQAGDFHPDAFTKREENENSSCLKRNHFVNTITIVRKEDEPEETRISESSAINSDDRNLVVEDEKTIDNELKVYKIIVEEGESSDVGNDNKTSDFEDEAYKDETKLGKEGDWMEYEQPLNLVDVRDESIY
ncbi:hypothetical protein Tco_0983840 [Tanacetum coccineum]